MPNDLAPALAPNYDTLPTTKLDDEATLNAVCDRLLQEMGPTSSYALALAQDIIQIEMDILRLRQAKADVADGALRTTLDHLFHWGDIKIGRHTDFMYGQKLTADIMRGRRGISRRLKTVLHYFGQSLADIRAKAFKSHMDVTHRIETQLERFERRRRNLRRDFDLYQSTHAQIIEAGRGNT